MKDTQNPGKVTPGTAKLGMWLQLEGFTHVPKILLMVFGMYKCTKHFALR